MSARRLVTRSFFALLLVFIFLAVAGCGDSLRPVRGKVVFEDGRPVPVGEVVFHLDEERVYSGEIQEDGTFELDAPPGWYQVVICGADEDGIGMPTVHYRYADVENTPLNLEVVAGENAHEIRVKRGMPVRPDDDDGDDDGDDEN